MKIIGFILLMIANLILSYNGINFMTWEWWALMVCIVGWSVCSHD